MFAAVAHGTQLNLCGAGRDTYHHTERRREPAAFAADHLDEAANHVLGGIEVGYHTVYHGTNRADTRAFLAFHLMSCGAHGYRFACLDVHGNY